MLFAAWIAATKHDSDVLADYEFTK